MVRVISVHHFASQQIQTIEQPTASTIAPPNRLLLALSSHCVEVRNLEVDSEIFFTFPTVDRVTELHHCLTGNYVLTTETKNNRQNRSMNYIRVYVNWDSVAALQQSKMTNSGLSLNASECGMVQPMRARIAGRVTPTINQSEIANLEMIEMPVTQNPTGATCCQISGNILIQTGNSITFYAFQLKTHDISKLKFIDFEEQSFFIQLGFNPTQICFAENYVAYLKDDSVHVFRMTFKNDEDDDKSSEETITRLIRGQEPIDYAKLLQEETISKNLITVKLPSIVKSNSLVHRHSPFTFIDKEMSAIVKSRTIDNLINVNIENLVQLKLKPILIENAQTQLREEFKSLNLKPLYVDQMHKRNDGPMGGRYRQQLHSVVCLIATQQEGYLYQVPDFESNENADYCISVYPFTAPVTKVVLEDGLLHALTETGLESYTVRIGHKLCQSDVIDPLNNACPSIDDTLCLVGLRPFVGIEQMLIADNYLILMANADTSPTHSIGSSGSSTPSTWTLYNLELPDVKTIFDDISIVANNHRFTSPQTYCHLMSEAHMILRLSLRLIHWKMDGVGVAYIKTSNEIRETYKHSCALLGDHYVMSQVENEYKMAVPYYKMAELKPTDVLKRVKEIHLASNLQTTTGLVNYLKVVLSDLKFRTEVDMFLKTAWTQNFADEVLTIFENNNMADIPILVLKNWILREYSTNRFIDILSQQPKYDDIMKETEKKLALTLLYLQKGLSARAEQEFNTIDDVTCLHSLLLANYDLLFDSAPSNHINQSAFSDLSILIISKCGSIVSLLLVKLIEEKKTTLNRILKIFIEYLPSRIGSDGNKVSGVLQETLELYFKSYFETKDTRKIVYDKCAHEAMKILVRLYFSQLQMLQLKEIKRIPNEQIEIEEIKDEPNETIKYNQIINTQFPNKINKCTNEQFLFERMRHAYLERMPPFSKLDHISQNDTGILLLRKLQAILCSKSIPKQILIEADAFLSLNENLRGFTSLKSIIMEVDDALLFLVEECPQCLLQFAKDRFSNKDQWKRLIISLQNKIQQLTTDPDSKRICFLYRKILKDVLIHCAAAMSLDDLQQVLPPRDDCREKEILDELFNYDHYITICKETAHANQLKQLIVTTAQQLLTSLNL